VSWAKDLARKLGARRESLVVIAADHWAEVSVFETPDLRMRGRGGQSRLQSVLRSLGAGQTRDFSNESGDQLFFVKEIPFACIPELSCAGASSAGRPGGLRPDTARSRRAMPIR